MPKIRSLESGTSRRENITDWALNQFRRHYHDLSITKWDTFHYVYAVLHHPAYRERYAANLKRESPCIPFIGAHGVTTAADFVITTEDASPEEGSVVSLPNHDLGAPSSPSFGEGGITTSADHRESLKGRAFRRADIDATTNPRAALPRAGAQPQAERQKESAATNPDATIFHAFAAAGQRLADLHVNYEQQPEYPLTEIWKPGSKLNYRVEKMRLGRDKTSLMYNDDLTLSGIPIETFEYRLGNRSALDWVIDHYQVSTDKRSGINNDPNREDDPQYILRLIKQVIHVSVETVKIVNAVPAVFANQSKAVVGTT